MKCSLNEHAYTIDGVNSILPTAFKHFYPAHLSLKCKFWGPGVREGKVGESPYFPCGHGGQSTLRMISIFCLRYDYGYEYKTVGWNVSNFMFGRCFVCCFSFWVVCFCLEGWKMGVREVVGKAWGANPVTINLSNKKNMRPTISFLEEVARAKPHNYLFQFRF